MGAVAIPGATARRPLPRRVRAGLGGTLRIGVLAVLALGGTAGFAVLHATDPGQVQLLLIRVGGWAPLLFVSGCAVLTMLGFPKPVLAAAAGLAFGTALGTVLAVLGASLGAAGAYFLARRVGREPVLHWARDSAGMIAVWLGSHGFVAVLYARLLPAVPFALANYAAGVSSVRFGEFIAATALGIIPGTWAFAALGGSVEDPSPPVVLTAVGLSVTLAVAGPLLTRARCRLVGVTHRRDRARPRTSWPPRAGDRSAGTAGRSGRRHASSVTPVCMCPIFHSPPYDGG